jgi:hypothetical protein
MRKRDAAIVLLSCFGLFLSLEDEGAISFRKAWCATVAGVATGGGGGRAQRAQQRPSGGRWQKARVRAGRAGPAALQRAAAASSAPLATLPPGSTPLATRPRALPSLRRRSRCRRPSWCGALALIAGQGSSRRGALLAAPGLAPRSRGRSRGRACSRPPPRPPPAPAPFTPASPPRPRPAPHPPPNGPLGQTDLNGDGSLEVVVVTHDYSLQLLKPQPPGRAGDGFAHAGVLAQVSLLPSKISIGVDRRPVRGRARGGGGLERGRGAAGRGARRCRRGQQARAGARAEGAAPPPPSPSPSPPSASPTPTPLPTPNQVALAAGYLDPEPREKVRAPRKQVLVVVTAGWRVLAFDHNLALMWEGDAEGGPGRGRARPHEVAVTVMPHRVRAADRGLIVVGGDVEVGAGAADADGGRPAAAEGAGRAGGVLEGVLQEELKWEAGGGGGGGGAASGSAAKDGGEGGKDAGAGAAAGTALGAGADASRHFDYYAFEGATGEARWSHTAGSFHGGELEAAAEELTPQHSFRLDAEKLAGRHYGELSCRDFRESVLHSLPHYWGRPEDTRLEEAHFVRHREGLGERKRDLARAGAARAAAAGARGLGVGWQGEAGTPWQRVSALCDGRASVVKSLRTPPQPPPAPFPPSNPGRGAAKSKSKGWLHTKPRRAPPAARQHQKGVASRHPQLRHNHTANALVTHLEQGLEVVHLFTGARPEATVASGSGVVGARGRARLVAAVPTCLFHTPHNPKLTRSPPPSAAPPGRTLCELHLPPEQLHADVNGDGVIDHIALAPGDASRDDAGPPRLAHVQTRRHTALGACMARATSGVPPNEVLWVADVCARRESMEAALLPTGGREGFANAHGVPPSALNFAPPAFLPVPRADGTYSHLRGQNGIVGVLSSDGAVTALNGRGARLWQVQLGEGGRRQQGRGLLGLEKPVPCWHGSAWASLTVASRLCRPPQSDPCNPGSPSPTHPSPRSNSSRWGGTRTSPPTSCPRSCPSRSATAACPPRCSPSAPTAPSPSASTARSSRGCSSRLLPPQRR